MNIFNRRPKTIALEDPKSVLRGRCNPVTVQSVLMIETDADAHRKFTKNFHTNLNLLLKLQSQKKNMSATA